ncbi:hypothetical protein OG552_35900 [Streptomyces sp. NBC_01476]|uniref:hypothetical protein n=1 Tax=Streptomyces sp. NBC_01476 TaxID=2903881 RepID=UPI002E32E4B1|nr:hypothetical protein [Streptomyces sp. NBC_01476]
MSEYAKESYLGGRVILGPEFLDGTGQVYLAVPDALHLDGTEARELAAAILDAADDADARQHRRNPAV